MADLTKGSAFVGSPQIKLRRFKMKNILIVLAVALLLTACGENPVGPTNLYPLAEPVQEEETGTETETEETQEEGLTEVTFTFE